MGETVALIFACALSTSWEGGASPDVQLIEVPVAGTMVICGGGVIHVLSCVAVAHAVIVTALVGTALGAVYFTDPPLSASAVCSVV